MSAFVVSPVHIDLMLSTAIHGPSDDARDPGMPWTPPYANELLSGESGPLRPERADRVGAALLAECIASVSHRYPDPDSAFVGLPGPLPTPDPLRYEWSDPGWTLTAVEGQKAIDCYEYQSCEHPAWGTSGAFAFCERLRRALIGAMRGYQEAPWEWTSEMALERAGEGLRRGVAGR